MLSHPSATTIPPPFSPSQVNKGFVKGYFRLALAQKSMHNFEAALESIKKGLTVDFGNSDLKNMRKEVRAWWCVWRDVG